MNLDIDGLFEKLADKVAQRLRAEGVATSDPAWGMVSQKTLPEWLPVEAYIDACRAGKITGAVKWRRQWIAPREAVLAWVISEGRSGNDNDNDDGTTIDPESTEGILRANDITVRR